MADIHTQRTHARTHDMSVDTPPGMLSGESAMDLVMKVAHQSHVYKLGLYFERAVSGQPSVFSNAAPGMLGAAATVELGPFTARNG